MRFLHVSLVAAGMVGAVVAGGAQTQVQTGAGPLIAPGLVAGPSAPSRTGLLMGQVVDGATGRPISDAIVSVNGGGARGLPPGVAPPAGADSGRGGATPSPRVLADSQGRFLFRDLPPGPLMIAASKPGYFGGVSGQQSPRGQGRPVELLDAERMGGVTLRLWAYGSVSGTIFDETGAPATGVNVQLLKRTALNGRWQFSVGAGAPTDDRGMYHIGSVLPGDYLVAVRPDPITGERLLMSMLMADEASAMKMLPKLMESGQESLRVDSSVRMYPAAFYPGSPDSSQATLVTVESGGERGSVDFHVKAVPVRTIAGTVSGPGLDRASESINLRLRSADATTQANDFSAPTASMDPNGRFFFTGVPAGAYVLEAVSRSRGTPNDVMAANSGGGAALPPAPEMPTFSAIVPVTVADRDIPNLDVTVTPGGRVSGRVEFDGADRPTDELLNRVFVTLEPVDGLGSGRIPPGRVEADGTFRTASVAPGRYLLRVGTVSAPTGSGSASPTSSAVIGPPGAPKLWHPVSATINGHDPLDEPLDLEVGDVTSVLVTFTDKAATELIGAIRDVKGDFDPQAVVLAFSTDTRLWGDFGGSSRRIKLTRASRYGQYSIAGLAAGEYYVVVGTDDTFADMQAPGALDSYTRLATRVVLVDGQTKTLDLKSGGR